jgi:ATP-dependent DNA helicase RecG
MIALPDITGIGPVRVRLLARLGINSVEKLLTHFPVRYERRTDVILLSQAAEKVPALFCAKCLMARKRFSIKTRKTIVEAVFVDGSGKISVSWFNQPYVASSLVVGEEFFLYGKPTIYKGKSQLISPHCASVKSASHIGIMPVYPLTDGLKQSVLRALVAAVMPYARECPDPLPADVVQSEKLMSRAAAFAALHTPKNEEELQTARARFVFEEFFVMQSQVYRRKAERLAAEREGLCIDRTLIAKAEGAFGFPLTNSQRAVLDDLFDDMECHRKGGRLLQGDVGSGKTAVALIAAIAAVRAGKQAAIMAPTEVLAMQHCLTAEKICAAFDIRVAYLGSATKTAERKKLTKALTQGEIGIVIGTQALLSDDVVFRDLRFAVVDEQHRFGVCQRAALAGKGASVDMLVMSATPIPRTLALTMYGDLDASKITEYPAGRQKAQTAIIPDSHRERVYAVIEKKLREGKQAYVVYALVEESDESDLPAAIQMHEVVAARFKGYAVGLLHGRMSSEEKEAAIRDFREGRTRVLVSTLVVEVGVDVPNATMMLIENPERFGLAQLHQLRGRVMRSNDPSYCYLMVKPNISDTTRERLAVIERSCDGFEIAEADLKLRGPGDVFGVLQAGFVEFKLADVKRDFDLLKRARRAAHEYVMRAVGSLHS